MNRLDILNLLSAKINAKSYLEIGVSDGYTFNSINIAYKIGVDPDTSSAANIFATSDDFFSKNSMSFDLIFIDGLHHAEQVERDINNSLLILNNNGYIVCHDMIPLNKKMQSVPRIQKAWTGDCWKAWLKFRSQRNDLNMYTVDIDYGCGIISFGKQNIITIEHDLTFDNFCKYKQEWMNIVSIENFISGLK